MHGGAAAGAHAARGRPGGTHAHTGLAACCAWLSKDSAQGSADHLQMRLREATARITCILPVVAGDRCEGHNHHCRLSQYGLTIHTHVHARDDHEEVNICGQEHGNKMKEKLGIGPSQQEQYVIVISTCGPGAENPSTYGYCS